MSAPVGNAFELAGRRKKVARLVRLCLKANVTAEDARAADAAAWKLAAEAAGVNMPSAETIAMVIEQLEREHCAICEGFGFPGCVEDLEEPPCECERVDVDVVDPRGCEVHDSSSRWRRCQAAHESVTSGRWVEPVRAEPVASSTNEECPF